MITNEERVAMKAAGFSEQEIIDVERGALLKQRDWKRSDEARFTKELQTLDETATLCGMPFAFTGFQQWLLFKFIEKRQNKSFRIGLLIGIGIGLLLWWLSSIPSHEVLDPYVPLGD